MKMHTGNQNNDVSLAKEFQQNLTKDNHKNGVIDQGKYKKRFMKWKWTDGQYHVQYNADFSKVYVIIYCNTNQFPALTFLVHVPNLMVQEGWVSIITWFLIQK